MHWLDTGINSLQQPSDANHVKDPSHIKAHHEKSLTALRKVKRSVPTRKDNNPIEMEAYIIIDDSTILDPSWVLLRSESSHSSLLLAALVWADVGRHTWTLPPSPCLPFMHLEPNLNLPPHTPSLPSLCLQRSSLGEAVLSYLHSDENEKCSETKSRNGFGRWTRETSERSEEIGEKEKAERIEHEMV